MRWTALLAGILLPAIQVSASAISWSGATYTNTGDIKQVIGTDQFNQSGTSLLAVNLGGPAVVFDNATAPDIAFTSSSPNLTLTSGLDSQYNSFYNTDPSLPNNSLGYDGLYSGNGAATLTLNNLTSGQQYRIQALVVDGRGDQSGRTVSFDGTSVGTYATGVSGVTWGDSLLATGLFTADSTSQSFTVENFDPGGGSAGGQLNAILVNAVPEPSILGLLALVPFALGRRGFASRRISAA